MRIEIETPGDRHFRIESGSQDIASGFTDSGTFFIFLKRGIDDCRTAFITINSGDLIHVLTQAADAIERDRPPIFYHEELAEALQVLRDKVVQIAPEMEERQSAALELR